MLYLVISTPRPEQPSAVAAARQSFWTWIAEYQHRGICRHAYPRVGRGVIAVFDIVSNEKLHHILNEWADIIPASFEIHPLVDQEASRALLAAQAAAMQS